MDSVDLQVLRSAREWVKAGRRVVMATVVRTWGSAPRPIGALTAIRDDGVVVGSARLHSCMTGTLQCSSPSP